ncbi:MAG: hypothetical protein Q9160_008907 [Pyrenula sp. 1 TL-2023]
MASPAADSVDVKVTNRGANYREDTKGIPVNGVQQSIAAVFGSAFPNGKVVINVIEVTQPGNAAGINIQTGPPEGPLKTVRTDGTPLKVNGDDGRELDVTNWVIVASR